jgi:ribosomal protein L11 methyltransferase
MLFKLRINTSDLDSGRLTAALIGELTAPQPLAVTLFENAPPSFVVEAYYDCEPALEVIDRLIGFLGSGLQRPTVELVPDENWVALSQQALPPVTAGRFLIHGSHDRERIGGRRHAIEVDAGEAFGTGHNATTALCLEVIDALTRQWKPARILDLGCGTAVLAIAAAHACPRAVVLAIDNDPVATAVARANVRTNRLAARIHVLDAEGFRHPLLRAPASFDLLLANILPGPLIRLAPEMRRALRRGGIAVLSGLLDHQAREVHAACAMAGFHLLRRNSRHGWTTLTLVRR